VSDVYVGLMSGTSLDGISAAAVRFRPEKAPRLRPELLGFTVTEYSPDQRRRMHAATSGGTAQ
jgi:anhydro-N-acetylmuramic acid kinase